MGHWPPAAEFIKQTTGAGSLPELHRGLLVFEELHSRATRLRERLEERLWPLEIIEGNIVASIFL